MDDTADPLDDSPGRPGRGGGEPRPDRRAAPLRLVDRAGAWLGATPTELIGLTVLLAGAVVVTALAFWDAGQRPRDLPPAASVGGVGVPDRSDHHDDHAVGGTGQAGAGSGSRADPAPASGAGDVEVTNEVTVHVSGAVRTPGVVTLVPVARVADAISAAGGATGAADLERLNLARILLDGEQVHVPRPGEERLPEGPHAGPAVGADVGIDADGRVDLNIATQAQLESLPGIGPAKAVAIITHREVDGPFQVPGDLRAVPGIGERTFQQLAELITVG